MSARHVALSVINTLQLNLVQCGARVKTYAATLTNKWSKMEFTPNHNDKHINGSICQHYTNGTMAKKNFDRLILHASYVVCFEP